LLSGCLRSAGGERAPAGAQNTAGIFRRTAALVMMSFLRPAEPVLSRRLHPTASAAQFRV
jgi:hypothetical protein